LFTRKHNIKGLRCIASTHI